MVGALAVLGHDPEDLRTRARELLSRPPYRDGDEGLIADLVRRLRETAARWLEAVLETLGGDARIAWVIVAVGTVLLAVTVWRATRGWNADRTVTPVAPRRPVRTAAEWHREADGHAAAGRWREAVRCRYAALVTALVEGGVVPDVPGRTVRELDREVAASAPTLAGAVRAAGATFEEAWYGHGEVGRDDLEVVAGAVDAVAGIGGRRREERV
jgi:hypothetical protein